MGVGPKNILTRTDVTVLVSGMHTDLYGFAALGMPIERI